MGCGERTAGFPSGKLAVKYALGMTIGCHGGVTTIGWAEVNPTNAVPVIFAPGTVGT
jgi:hypothetical protein